MLKELVSLVVDFGDILLVLDGELLEQYLLLSLALVDDAEDSIDSTE